MKHLTLLILTIVVFTTACDNKKSVADHAADSTEIKRIINDYDNGWDSKDIDLVLAGYSDDIDWTNAFGDRVQGKDQLRDLLETIFSLEFVMAGKNNYQQPDISFPNNEIAIARSTNIRSGQKWPDGRPMNDRVINHIRIFKKLNGKWTCFNHMISQAHDKMGN